MCDGQPADDCNFMNLAEFENTLKDRLAKLDDQFSVISDILNEKKKAFVEMYRENPKISHDKAILLLKTINENFDPSNPEEQTILQKQLAEQLGWFICFKSKLRTILFFLD